MLIFILILKKSQLAAMGNVVSRMFDELLVLTKLRFQPALGGLPSLDAIVFNRRPKIREWNLKPPTGLQKTTTKMYSSSLLTLLTSLEGSLEVYKSIGCPLLMPSNWRLGHWNASAEPAGMWRDPESIEEGPEILCSFPGRMRSVELRCRGIYILCASAFSPESAE